MDAAGREEEYVSGLHVVAAEGVGDGSIGHLCSVLVGSELLLEAYEKVCIGGGVHYVPHFGLAFAAVVPFGGQFVVGVHLDGEVLLGVDVFDQHGELVSGVLIHVLADELAFIFLRELCDGLSREGTFGHDAFVVHYAGKLPALRAPYKGL